MFSMDEHVFEFREMIQTGKTGKLTFSVHPYFKLLIEKSAKNKNKKTVKYLEDLVIADAAKNDLI